MLAAQGITFLDAGEAPDVRDAKVAVERVEGSDVIGVAVGWAYV